MTTLSGYAAIFALADVQADVLRPGAFRATIARRGARVPLLWQHDLAEPVGRILELREDGRGLWFRAELSATRRAADADALIRAGALRECSIGFVPQRVRFEPLRNGKGNGRSLRVIHELELIEISLVTLAANAAARLLTVDGVPLGTAPPSPLAAARLPVLSPVEGHGGRTTAHAARASTSLQLQRLGVALPLA